MFIVFLVAAEASPPVASSTLQSLRSADAACLSGRHHESRPVTCALMSWVVALAGVSIRVAAVALDVLAPLNQRCAYALFRCHENTSFSFAVAPGLSHASICSRIVSFSICCFRIWRCIAVALHMECTLSACRLARPLHLQLEARSPIYWVPIRNQVDAVHAFTFCDRWRGELLSCVVYTLPRYHLYEAAATRPGWHVETCIAHATACDDTASNNPDTRTAILSQQEHGVTRLSASE